MTDISHTSDESIPDTKEHYKSVEEDQEDIEKNPTVHLIPTSHVSQESSDRVSETIQSIQPDAIVIELDESRYTQLTDSEISQDISFKDLLKKSHIPLRGRLFLGLMAILQNKISSELGMGTTGVDMLSAIESSEKFEIPLLLVDRPISETINSFTSSSSLTELSRMMFYFGITYFKFENQSQGNMKKQAKSENINIEDILIQLEQEFPSFKRSFIDERNSYIVENILQIIEQYKNIVLVIGAGHKPGIKEQLSEYEHITINEHTSENEDILNDL